MNNYLIVAKFIGSDGSLGYEKDHVYRLIMTVNPEASYPVIIKLTDGRGYCPYASVEKFEENWEVIEEVESYG